MRRPPAVLARLFAEHRYLTALAHTLAAHSATRSRIRKGELYLLRDVVAYLHDYPDHVHHPTEELLFERLLRRKPALTRMVTRLRRDHVSLAKETGRLLRRLDEAIARPSATRARAALAACRALAAHQHAHLQLENQQAFPAALAALSRADWRHVEARFLDAEDPLFGKAVSRRHRRLYEYLLDFTDAGERAGRLRALLAGLQDAAKLAARFGWQIGRAVSAGSGALLMLCAATALSALAVEDRAFQLALVDLAHRRLR